MQKSTVGRRLAIRVVVILAITAGLAACRPAFPYGSTLTTATEGNGVRISWPGASTDADTALASYRIDVDGAEVARLAPSEQSCVLSGLTAGTDHAVEVTAYDAGGLWSKESAFTAAVVGTVTGPVGSTGGPDSPINCEVVAPRADVSVVLSQPSPGADTKLISGQVAPVTYELAVTNAGSAASGEVVVTNPIPAGTTLVVDSPSCGTATGCSVAAVDDAVEWTLSDVPTATTVTLTFSVTMNPDIGTIRTIISQATYTDQSRPGCDPTDCTTNPVTNPAEPWAWVGTEPGFIPGNVVFFSGINHFRAIPQLTNDPAATITYRYVCIPDYLCQILHAEGDQVTFNFIYDEFENTDLYKRVFATATQGDRQMERDFLRYFRLIDSCEYGC